MRTCHLPSANYDNGTDENRKLKTQKRRDGARRRNIDAKHRVKATSFGVFGEERDRKFFLATRDHSEAAFRENSNYTNWWRGRKPNLRLEIATPCRLVSQRSRQPFTCPLFFLLSVCFSLRRCSSHSECHGWHLMSEKPRVNYLWLFLVVDEYRTRPNINGHATISLRKWSLHICIYDNRRTYVLQGTYSSMLTTFTNHEKLRFRATYGRTLRNRTRNRQRSSRFQTPVRVTSLRQLDEYFYPSWLISVETEADRRVSHSRGKIAD